MLYYVEITFCYSSNGLPNLFVDRAQRVFPGALAGYTVQSRLLSRPLLNKEFADY